MSSVPLHGVLLPQEEDLTRASSNSNADENKYEHSHEHEHSHHSHDHSQEHSHDHSHSDEEEEVDEGEEPRNNRHTLHLSPERIAPHLINPSVAPEQSTDSSFVQLIGPGFWNFRGSWKYKGFIEIGSQMSAVQLASGKFLILDCIELKPDIKVALDKLTDNGSLIEACILTHPFHVAHFPGFIKAYPHVDCYGGPRHMRKFPHIDWKGNVTDCRTRGKWAPEVDMSIPAGCEFNNPLPEMTNHMCGMFVFHAPSKTIHENDTLMVGYKPNVLLKIDGYRHLKLRFQRSITGPGLLPTPESPYALKNWLLDIMEDWDFENIAAGHMGCMIGGAKPAMQKLIVKSEGLFKQMSKKFKKQGKVSFVANGKHNLNLEADIFDGNLECECG